MCSRGRQEAAAQVGQRAGDDGCHAAAPLKDCQSVGSAREGGLVVGCGC
jgi:hypothetical protein